MTLRIRQSLRIESAIVGGIALGACCLVAWLGGKDVNFDQLNYHFYSGFSALHDRLQQDFMPASAQTYFNPYLYVPFYLLASAGLPAIVVGLALATMHAGNVLAIWWVATLLFPGHDPGARQLRLGATLLAALTPVFLLEVGTSFADALVSIPLLCGMALAIGAGSDATHPKGATGRLVGAGLLIGLALGLKPTGALLVPGLLGGLLLHPARLPRARSVLILGLAMVAGGLLSNGQWAWRLWSVFGNPVFPMFNAFFRSPDFVAANLSSLRFQPRSLSELLWLPLRLALPYKGIYMEVALPDIRLLGLALALLALALKAPFRIPARIRTAWPADVSQPAQCAARRFLLTFGLTGMLWAMASSNGRYGLVFLLLLGPAVALAIATLTPRIWLRGCLFVMIIAAQGFLLLKHSTLRFDPKPWSAGPWFNLKIDPKLTSTPHLLVTLDGQPGAFMLPFLAPGSAMMNVSGQNPLSLAGPGGRRVEALLTRFPDSTVLVIKAKLYDVDGVAQLPPAEQINWRAATVGLALVPDGQCMIVQLADETGGAVVETSSGNSDPIRGIAPPYTQFVACPAQAQGLMPTAAAKLSEYDAVFAALEQACPVLLSPAPGITVFDGSRHERAYSNSDISIRIAGDQIFYRPLNGLSAPLGRATDILDRGVKRCPERD